MIKLRDATYGPITFTSELRAQGVQSRDIAAAVDAGDLVRVAPGVVVTPEVYASPDLEPALACHATGGVIGLLSAAVRHGLCDAAPNDIEVLVPIQVVRPPAGLPVRVVRSRNPETLKLGVERSDFHGIELRVTYPARTIVDLYRVEPASHRQHAVAALATFMRDGGDERTLYQYARAFDVWSVIGPEVEAIAEAQSRGMRP